MRIATERLSLAFPISSRRTVFDKALRCKEFLEFFAESLFEFSFVALQRFFIFGVSVKENAEAFDLILPFFDRRVAFRLRGRTANFLGFENFEFAKRFIGDDFVRGRGPFEEAANFVAIRVIDEFRRNFEVAPTTFRTQRRRARARLLNNFANA